jgi:hypothetical protein
MQRLGDAVRNELGRFGSAGAMADVVDAWPGAVGETIAANAWPARLARDGTLHVNTVSSTWAFELGRLAPTILEQLRAQVGSATPPALKFTPGPVPEPAGEAAATRSPAPSAPTAVDRAEAAAAAAAIEDPELRELVARAAAASLAKARSDRHF